jgi:hypothetical protein
VEIVCITTENQTSILSLFLPKVEIEHSCTQVVIHIQLCHCRFVFVIHVLFVLWMHKILLLILCDEIFERHSASLLSQMDNWSLMAVIWDITCFLVCFFSQSFVISDYYEVLIWLMFCHFTNVCIQILMSCFSSTVDRNTTLRKTLHEGNTPLI